MTSRRDFLRRGALWLAAAPTVAEVLDRLAWQERRIFALGAMPTPPGPPEPPARGTIGWMDIYTGKPGAPNAVLLATIPFEPGASGIVDATGEAGHVVYRVPANPHGLDLLRQVGFTHTEPAARALDQTALVAGHQLTLTSITFTP